MNEIKLDCYWYIEEKDDEEYPRAICIKCHEEAQFGWYWPGATKGYGPNSEILCSLCNNHIYKKEVANDTEEN